MHRNANLNQNKCKKQNYINVYSADYERITSVSSLLLPHRLPILPGLELDAGDGSLLSIGLK